MPKYRVYQRVVEFESCIVIADSKEEAMDIAEREGDWEHDEYGDCETDGADLLDENGNRVGRDIPLVPKIKHPTLRN